MAARAAAPNQTGVPKNIPAQPPVTGSMYNGNNTKPSQLSLRGPLASGTRALERTETSAAKVNGQSEHTNANQGGGSSNARAGGGG